MKLLFDQNLSPRLVNRLADVYPESNHVHPLGLDKVSDVEVWQYARLNGFIIVTKDVDFSELSAVNGFPPKLIWLRLGNCTTNEIEQTLRAHHQDAQDMNDDENAGILSLI